MYLTLSYLSLVASLANISLISLERLHATLFPFRHCLVGNQFYLAIILWSWLFSLILSSMFSLLILRASPVFPYVSASYFFLCLLILTVSYAIIISNGKNNPHHPNTGLALSKEGKLTVTLFPVTVVSFLTILPIYLTIRNVNSSTAYGVSYAMQPFSASLTHFLCDIMLYCFSSIFNPLIYAVRMQEFRKAVQNLVFTKRLQLTRVQPNEQLT